MGICDDNMIDVETYLDNDVKLLFMFLEMTRLVEGYNFLFVNYTADFRQWACISFDYW